MAEHIRIRPAQGTYVIRASGAVIGETGRALELTEGSHPPVIYVPREDLAMALMDSSDHTSVCPHKGMASYYSIVTKDRVLKDVAWSYEKPLDAMSAIAGHLAFYPDKVTVQKSST